MPTALPSQIGLLQLPGYASDGSSERQGTPIRPGARFLTDVPVQSKDAPRVIGRYFDAFGL